MFTWQFSYALNASTVCSVICSSVRPSDALSITHDIIACSDALCSCWLSFVQLLTHKSHKPSPYLLILSCTQHNRLHHTLLPFPSIFILLSYTYTHVYQLYQVFSIQTTCFTSSSSSSTVWLLCTPHTLTYMWATEEEGRSMYKPWYVIVEREACTWSLSRKWRRTDSRDGRPLSEIVRSVGV